MHYCHIIYGKQTFLCIGPLTSVKNLTAQEMRNHTIQISWDPPETLDLTDIEPDISHYIVRIRSNSSNSFQEETITISETEYIFRLRGIDQCMPYEIMVTGVNLVGSGANSTVHASFSGECGHNHGMSEIVRVRSLPCKYAVYMLPEIGSSICGRLCHAHRRILGMASVVCVLVKICVSSISLYKLDTDKLTAPFESAHQFTLVCTVSDSKTVPGCHYNLCSNHSFVLTD